MKTVKLDVKSRDKSVKTRDLRNNDILPIEFYGKGIENKSYQTNYQNFRKVYKEAGSSTVVTLVVDGKEEHFGLIHEVVYHPVSDKITHVDMLNIRMDQEITAKIPLEFVGVSLAVKDQSGTLIESLSELEVKCLPKDLVRSIEVSIEPLIDFNSNIYIKDLKIPAGIVVLDDPEAIVISVVPPKVEEEVPVSAASVEGQAEGATPEGGSAAEGEKKAE